MRVRAFRGPAAPNPGILSIPGGSARFQALWWGLAAEGKGKDMENTVPKELLLT